MSARNKLMLSIGVLIALIVTILSIFGYSQINDSSTSDYRHDLSSKSFLIAHAVESKIESYFIAMETLAESLHIENGEVDVNDKTIDSLVNNKNRMKVANFFIGLPDGTTYAATSHGMIPNFNAKLKKREWFTLGMSGVDKAVTNPYLDVNGEITMVTLLPVKQYDKIVAIIGISLKVKDISEYVRKLDPELHLFISRHDGFLMASSYPDLVGKNVFDLRPTYRQHSEEDRSEHSYNVPDKGDFYVVSSKAKFLDWTIWAWAKWDDINKTSNDAVKTNLIVGSIFILIGIGVTYYLITKLMYVPIGGEPKEIEQLVDKIANGDLTNIPEIHANSVGVYRSTLTMANNLKGIISDINQSSRELIQASEQLGESSGKVDSSSKSQMMQLEQVATAMNEMTATVAEVAKNAVDASRSSNDASDSSKEGLNVVAQMNEDINKLVDDIEHVREVITSVHSETENVGGILDVIRGIADQTNLLALNAAIEAARAGEHGRGFAVVADEVRTLATKTQESTNEIQSMIESLQEQASESVNLMKANAASAEQTLVKSDEAKGALDKIETEIHLIQDMNNQIATAAEEQSNVATEINESVVTVNDLATSTAEDVQENVRTSENLNSMANRLSDAIKIFKI